MMDAFTGGVDYGGLTNQNQIRLLVCYMLYSVDAPLSSEQMLAIIFENGLANYFETGDAIARLRELGHIRESEEGGAFVITESGLSIIRTLEADLPFSVREKAAKAAVRLLARIKTEIENPVEIKASEDGYTVTCRVCDGGRDLLLLSLHVADMLQANTVKEQFLSDPGRVYSGVLALQTGDKSFYTQFFENDEKP